MGNPKIRPLEAFPIEQEGQTFICLRDPSGLAPEPIVLGMGAYFLVTLFDGQRSARDLQAAFSQRFGEMLPADRLGALIAALDRGYFLDSAAFAERLRDVTAEFNAGSERAAAHAGLCYDTQAEGVRAELEGFFIRAGGPGAVSATRDQPALAGLVAPHIDPRRGAPAYACAYGELARRRRPELVIILGTSHYGAGPELFAATRKNYATPLGVVKTDGDFVSRLARRYKEGDLFADELLHRNEHSIEFQALFLAFTLGTEGYEAVPILVSSFHEMVAARTRPADDPRVAGFLNALRGELAADRRRVLILAGVDFAHVGRKFGDPFAVDEETVQRVERDDAALIEHIKRGDPEGFFSDVAGSQNRNKICGLAPMYVQLEMLAGRPGRLLKYGIALEPETESAVTFASLAID